MTRLQATLARVGATLTVAALVVVPPVLVALLIGRPYPDWSTLTDEIDQGRVSADTVMRIAAILFVAIWIWLALTIAAETYRLLRARAVSPDRTPRSVDTRPVGRRITVLHRLVRVAVLGTVTTATTISTWPTAALASTGSSLAGTLDPTPPVTAPEDPTDTAPSTPQTTTIVADGRATPLSIAADLGDETLRDDIVAMNRTGTWTGGVFPAGTVVTIPVLETYADANIESPSACYVVQPNDGMWNVAEALLGDGNRHHELRQHLHGQEVAPGVVFDASTETIHPGWIFQAPSEIAEVGLNSAIHTVRRGDTLSGISGAHLGSPDRWPELWDLNQGAVMSDGCTFDDPDLIIPGWQIALPATETVDEPVAPSSSDAGEVVEAEPEPSDEPDEPSTADAPTVLLEQPAPVIEEPSALPAPPPSSALSTSASPPPPVAVPNTHAAGAVEAPSIFTEEERSIWPTVAAGSLLTAGLAALVARLRRRRLSRLESGHRLKPPSLSTAGTEHALLVRNAENDLSTITTLLRSITPNVGTTGGPPAVRAVQLGDERIEVLFARPAPDPPKGWTTIDGGHSWTHRFEDPVADRRQLLTPALVTIGCRSDESADEVLLDLETAGTLAIAGDRTAAIGLARSIAYELATYPLGVSMDVNLVGIDIPGAEHCDRTWIETTIDRAIRVAQNRSDRRAAGEGAPVERRAGLGEDDGSTDPQVFIVDGDEVAADGLDDLIKLCGSCTGAIAVVIGDARGAGERLVANADGTALWSGVDLAPPNVTGVAAEEIKALVDEAATAETELIGPAEILAFVECEAGVDGPDYRSTVDYQLPPYDILVRLMGEPSVDGVDLTANETELLALLACLRERTQIHIGLIHEAVGADRARKTIENRISMLRRKLGTGSNGEDLLPEARPGNHGRSKYVVSPLVVTDVELMAYRLAATKGDRDLRRALAVLEMSLPDMSGPILHSRRGFEFWPQSEGIVASATAIVKSFSARVIEVAEAVGRPEVAAESARRALLVLSDSAAPET